MTGANSRLRRAARGQRHRRARAGGHGPELRPLQLRLGRQPGARPPICERRCPTAQVATEDGRGSAGGRPAPAKARPRPAAQRRPEACNPGRHRGRWEPRSEAQPQGAGQEACARAPVGVPAGREHAGVPRDQPSAGPGCRARSGSASRLPSPERAPNICLPHRLALPQNRCARAPRTGAAQMGLQTRPSLRTTVALAAAPWKKGQGRKANPGQMLLRHLQCRSQPAWPLARVPTSVPGLPQAAAPAGASLATVWTQRTQLRVRGRHP